MRPTLPLRRTLPLFLLVAALLLSGCSPAATGGTAPTPAHGGANPETGWR